MKSEKIKYLILGLSLVLFAIVSLGFTSSEYKSGELINLADKYKTDKGSGGDAWIGHSYVEVYEYFFYPIKYEARKIFEIGVAEGASLKMLRDYFPNAVIYGIDIVDTSSLNSDTIKTFVADQSNRKELKDFIDTYEGGFDIILDDGGHSMEQQQVSFGYLFKYVKPGGYYIIEDVHTSLSYLYGDYFGAEENGDNTTLLMIGNFIEDGKIESKYMTAEEEDYLTANIKYCNLLSRHSGRSINCIFKKR